MPSAEKGALQHRTRATEQEEGARRRRDNPGRRRRWGHDDTYRLKRTEAGWSIRFISIGGPCDRGGRPYLYENLQHDSIAFPDNLPWWFEWLWDQARTQGLTAEAVQGALDQLAAWLRSIEENAPREGVWSGFSE